MTTETSPPRACPGTARDDDLIVCNKMGNPMGWNGIDDHKRIDAFLWAGPNVVCRRCLTAREAHPQWHTLCPDRLEVFSLAKGSKLGLSLIDERRAVEVVIHVDPMRGYLLKYWLACEDRSVVRQALEHRIGLFAKAAENTLDKVVRWVQP